MIDKNYIPKLYKSTANMTVKEWEMREETLLVVLIWQSFLDLTILVELKESCFMIKQVLSQLYRMKMGTKVSFSTQDIFLRKW